MIFVDTVAWLYLFDERQDDAQRRQAREFVHSINEPLCTSDLIIAETHKWLIHHGRPARIADQVLQMLINQQLAVIVPIEPQDRKAAAGLIHKYNDQKLSYEDAITAAQMYRLGFTRVFSFDKHFLLFPGIERVPL